MDRKVVEALISRKVGSSGWATLSFALRSKGASPRAIDAWRRFCGTTSCACKQGEMVKVYRQM